MMKTVQNRRYGHIKDAPGKLRRMFALAPSYRTYPPVFSHRGSPHLCEVYNQLQHGSCVLNTTLTVFDFQHHLLTEEFADLSRMFAYRQVMCAEGTDPATDGGCMPADAYQFLMQSGSCAERLWPYTADNSGLVNTPPAECFADALTNQALQDRSVPLDLPTIKSVLVNQPITIGITVFDGDNGLESETAAKTGIVGLPSSYNQLRPLGGHGVTLMGWDDAKLIPRPVKGIKWPWTKVQNTVGAVEIRNSWGIWGDAGNFWLPYEFLLNPDWCDSLWTFDKVE